MRRLILFGKRPRPGQVKTRLVPPLRPEQALALYQAFLADQIAFLRTFDAVAEVELWLDGPWRPEPRHYPGVLGLKTREQGEGDLGQRMLRAFQCSWREGAQATVLLGTDAPTLPATHVEQAFSTLEGGAPAVIAPARDGGYVLVGLDRPFAELFREVPWGGGEVLQVTIARARSAGIALTQLPAWYDVDDAEGLSRLRQDLPSGRAPRTAEILLRLDSSGRSVV